MKNLATACGLICLALAHSSPSKAQPRPPERIVTPAEVTALVRANALRPLGPPVRQRSIYTLRALSARGIEMRVVVDAHAGKLLAVDPVVTGPYGVGPEGMYHPRPPAGIPTALPPEAVAHTGAAEGTSADRLPAPRVAPALPLPRPRPSNLMVQKPDDGSPTTPVTAAPESTTKSEIAPSPSPEPIPPPAVDAAPAIPAATPASDVPAKSSPAPKQAPITPLLFNH